MKAAGTLTSGAYSLPRVRPGVGRACRGLPDLGEISLRKKEAGTACTLLWENSCRAGGTRFPGELRMGRSLLSASPFPFFRRTGARVTAGCVRVTTTSSALCKVPFGKCGKRPVAVQRCQKTEFRRTAVLGTATAKSRFLTPVYGKMPILACTVRQNAISCQPCTPKTRFSPSMYGKILYPLLGLRQGVWGKCCIYATNSV